jgi:hypothetical protein
MKHAALFSRMSEQRLGVFSVIGEDSDAKRATVPPQCVGNKRGHGFCGAAITIGQAEAVFKQS